MRIRTLTVPLCLFAAACSRAGAQTDADPVAYPEGYRSWTHVKSMVLFDDHPLADPFEGIHHVYANAAALKGLQDGSFADGAFFVFDLKEATQSQGALTEGTRKRLDVMLRDSSGYASTGGWGFDTFVGDSRSERLDQDVVASCYACHMSAANQSFVFSQWRP